MACSPSLVITRPGRSRGGFATKLQRVRLPKEPGPPAPPGDPLHHPGQDRPGAQPPTGRLPRTPSKSPSLSPRSENGCEDGVADAACPRRPHVRRRSQPAGPTESQEVSTLDCGPPATTATDNRYKSDGEPERKSSANDQSPYGAAKGTEQDHDEDRYDEPGMGTADAHTQYLAQDAAVLCQDLLVSVQFSPWTVLHPRTPLHESPQHPDQAETGNPMDAPARHNVASRRCSTHGLT